MPILRYFFAGFAAATLAVVTLAGFRGDFTTKTPIQVYPDMKAQPRFDPQHPSSFFADGRSARAVVPGTVPQGYTLPGRFAPTEGNNARAIHGPAGFSNALDYVNTGRIGEFWGHGLPKEVEATPALLARGQERFNISCAPCHGQTGAGNGIVSQYGLNGVANLQQSRIVTMPDGQIFETITHGKNTMGPYGSNITVEDRWAIIAYIRALQRSQTAQLADVPAEKRTELDKQ
jgi:mono/diheme cytochrome c family protein